MSRKEERLEDKTAQLPTHYYNARYHHKLGLLALDGAGYASVAVDLSDDGTTSKHDDGRNKIELRNTGGQQEKIKEIQDPGSTEPASPARHEAPIGENEEQKVEE